MGNISDERYAVCRNHPEKEQIFYLEKLIGDAGYPYFFNFWEDLRPVFGEPEGDPEKDINWDTYKFLIQVGQPAGYGLSQISVSFNAQGDPKLLELLDMRPAEGKKNPTAEDGELHFGLTAEQVMKIIEEFFKTAE